MTEQPTTRYACPACGTVHAHQSERYKNHVCHVCEKRARCTDHARGVVGYNVSPMGGGFAAWHAGEPTTTNDGQCAQVTTDHRVWIDGAEYRMDEAYMGGIVTTPLDPHVPVEQTVVWSLDVRGHVEWTSAGNPKPYYGFIAEKVSLVGLSRRRVSTWEWLVRTSFSDHRDNETVEQGFADSADAAKARVVEVLDALARQA